MIYRHSEECSLYPLYVEQSIRNSSIPDVVATSQPLSPSPSCALPIHVTPLFPFLHPLFSFCCLALSLNYQVQLTAARAAIRSVLPSAPELFCKFGTHWLCIEKALHCGCHSSHITSHVILVRNHVFYAEQTITKRCKGDHFPPF